MNKRGVALIICYMVISVLTILGAAFITRSVSERSVASKYSDSTQAFWLAEAGIQRVLWTISHNPGLINDNAGLRALANTYNSNGSFLVESITGTSIKTFTVSSTVSSITRRIQVNADNDWQRKIPGAVYSRGVVQVRFDHRDDAYIDGGVKPGIYSTDEVYSKKIGEGRIVGQPQGILENQAIPEGLQAGVWDTFDCNNLRAIAKANGTYFSATDDEDENNTYNKSGKYTLPVIAGQTNGVFFFDAKNGEPLDDDEINPGNKIKVQLKGTTAPMSGIIVVVGDLNIVDTHDYDFLFDGIILVLDNLKLSDNRHHRRSGTNDSDIVIRGAVLSENVLMEGRRRKKKSTVDINNATIEYSAESMSSASSRWSIVPGSWREL